MTVHPGDGVRPAGVVVPSSSSLASSGRGRPRDLHRGRWYTRDTLPMRPLEHLRALVRAAGPTATAWVVPGFGHAESGAAPVVERIGRWVSATIDP